MTIANGTLDASALSSLGADATSIFQFLSEAQVSAVSLRSGAMDLTTVINTALAAGVPLFWPAGLYTHSGQLNLPTTTMVYMRGCGELTEVKATAVMGHQLYKEGVDTGGSGAKAPVFIKDMAFNANRLADRCLRIGASKKGGLTNLHLDGFLVEGAQCGDDSGSSVAAYYENWIQHVIPDGGIGNAGSTATMPTYGLRLTSNATDNTVIDVVPSYITDAGLITSGGFNKLIDIHSYGSNVNDTGPKHNIMAMASTTIVAPESDNVTRSGVYIGFNSCTVTGGNSYWAPDNTPTGATVFGSISGTTLTATAVSPGALAVGQVLVGPNVQPNTVIEAQLSGTPGSTGTYTVSVSQTVSATNMTASGAVAVEVASGVTDATIVGHVLRGYNGINPAVRWLAQARPGGLVAVIGGDRFTPQINDAAANIVNQSFGLTRRTGYDTRLMMDAASGQRNIREMRLVNAVRYTDGFDASGNFIVSSWSGSTETTALKHFYSTGQWEFYGKAMVGSSGGALGFLGTTPISKQTLGAAATDPATTQALVNELRAKLIAYGMFA